MALGFYKENWYLFSRDYFTGKLLGKSVYLAALGSVIYATGVAENYAISQPAADFAGEKTVLPRLGTLTITEGA